MKIYDLIQVLWVEDDPKVIETYPLEAENYGIQLVNYPCWDDAKIALDKEFDRWSAIVLDAKCKYHRDSSDNAVVFLREALTDISVISTEKRRVIPWYILSGGAEYEITDSISEKRLEWDRDWTYSKNKTYYSKNADREMLYQRIKAHSQKSPRIQIREMYRDVFMAIEECKLGDECYNKMEELLLPIHFFGETSDVDYNKRFVNIRIILEHIFRDMGKIGILPKWGNYVNFRGSSCLLGGLDAKSNETILYECVQHKSILPKILAGCLKEMVDAVPSILHSNDESKENNKRNLPDYLPLVDNSTYLLKSYSFQLCDLILWYRNYLKEHQDIDMNKKLWKKKK